MTIDQMVGSLSYQDKERILANLIATAFPHAAAGGDVDLLRHEDTPLHSAIIAEFCPDVLPNPLDPFHRDILARVNDRLTAVHRNLAIDDVQEDCPLGKAQALLDSINGVSDSLSEETRRFLDDVDTLLYDLRMAHDEGYVIDATQEEIDALFN